MNEIIVSAVVDGKRTATLQVEADSLIIEETLRDAGRYIYSRRWQIVVDDLLIEWDDLTTVQQLAVVYQEVIYVLRSMAGSYHVNAARTEAGDAAQEEVEGKYL